MGFALSDYVRQLLTAGPELRGSLAAPVVVWEQTSPSAEELPIWVTTQAGQRPTRPVEGEPLVLPVVKNTGKVNPFSMGVTVGRNENNDLVLPDGTVSRFHAYLQQDGRGGWRLVDAESQNGTWLGGIKVPPNTPTPVPDGARLRFGDVEVTFFTPRAFLSWVQQKLGT